ncbi:MAG TPA: MASE1 domain-containing protein [Longimicrobium sp.]|nr:MASE1 domain-containing protein [Longimicrobium sp.]
MPHVSTAALTRALLRALILALAYFVAGRVGLSLAFVQANASPVWPPSGVALAGLLLWGMRYWPAVLVGAVAVTLSSGAALPYAVMAGAGNVIDALVGAWLLGRVKRIRLSLSGVRDVLRFVPLAALPGPAASALLGVGGLLLWEMLPLERAPVTALVWWTGNGTGVLVAAPVILAWAAARRPLTRQQALELACAAAGAVLVTLIAFDGSRGWYGASVPLSYAVFPFVTWAAMRTGLRGASTVTAAVAFAAVAQAARVVYGPLGEDDAQEALLFVQAYLALVSMTGLVLAALTHERRRAMRRERRARRNAQAAERRSAFLAEVGAALSGSLDHRETLARLSTLVVPRLADGCIVDEVDEDGRFGWAVTLHRDPGIHAVLEETRRLYPPNENPHSRVARAMATGLTEWVKRVTPEFERGLAVDERHLGMLRGLEMSAAVFVPLVARERTVGVLTLMRTGGRELGRRDVALAEEVARRAALYVDNARLYRSVRNEAAARQKVVSMVSHEVRNPLSTILLNATAALDDGARSGPARPPLEAVVLAAEQIRHLVQDLADVTRLEAGSLPVERVVFRPCAMLREAALLLEPLAARNGVRFEARIPADLPPVVGDRDRTLQVLGNLVGNAVRHTPGGGSIVIHAEAVEGAVRFSVADTGGGIEADALGGLFTPLWSGDVAARGMGLPLSRAIVEAQGGRMWAESDPGRGSRFYFTMPIHPDA